MARAAAFAAPIPCEANLALTCRYIACFLSEAGFAQDVAAKRASST
ncbi:hypothetical protein GFS60_06064 [Rhodococcus sp. WAY2]|nr:hypothetical protein GFS60_06064 [Rhodococcus sp. WAY2]